MIKLDMVGKGKLMKWIEEGGILPDELPRKIILETYVLEWSKGSKMGKLILDFQDIVGEGAARLHKNLKVLGVCYFAIKVASWLSDVHLRNTAVCMCAQVH